MDDQLADQLAEWGLTPADDALHPPNDDPWWTETAWFSWFVPERDICCYLYLMFRPNKNIQAGGVTMYDASAELPWEMLFSEYAWHDAIPEEFDLAAAELPYATTLEVIEPCRSFRLGYDHPELQYDLVTTAVARPMVTASVPPFNKGHIDQFMHTTGTMTLRGETIEVDSVSMRDRSWGPRQDGRQPQVGYDYAWGDDRSAFLTVSVYDWRADVDRVTTGFHIADGRWEQVTGGTRRVTRDGRGRPTEIAIEATDAAGRSIIANGSIRSRQATTTYPSMFCWNALAEWEVDDWRGFGEDQDVWHPKRWRAFAERLRNER